MFTLYIHPLNALHTPKYTPLHDRYHRCIPVTNIGLYILPSSSIMHDRYQPRASYDMVTRFLGGRAWDKTGDRPIPTCDECSGVGPFAGAALPECHGL